MKQSLTYYLMLLVMKLKGLKKSFSQDPIDYKKIRKEDVYHPKGSFFKQNIIRSFNISKSLITEIGKKENTSKLLIFVHGGAFISGPGQHHWDTIKEISKQTDYTIWMCNYPKAPEHKISEISENIDLIYNRALKEYQPNQISFIGGSVGGTLITALMQRLIAKKKQLPHKIILVSPVMDASMSNPDIDKVDQVDPMLSKVGLVRAKNMCAQDNDLKNVLMSPIYGSFEEFPETILFIAEHDVTYPDQKILVEKLKQTNTKITVITGKNMPHIWPFLPVMKEAKIALHELIQTLTNK